MTELKQFEDNGNIRKFLGEMCDSFDIGQIQFFLQKISVKGVLGPISSKPIDLLISAICNDNCSVFLDFGPLCPPSPYLEDLIYEQALMVYFTQVISNKVYIHKQNKGSVSYNLLFYYYSNWKTTLK